MNLEELDAQMEAQREENTKYIKLFEEELTKAGLSKKTIRNHVSNAELFLNDYMVDYLENEEMADGPGNINGFMSFFIEKCMWSTPATVKSTAASIKKFYACMKDHGLVDEDDYKWLCAEIKENMEYWQDDCRRYNSDDFDFEDWF